jgi:hypothetical protein
LHDAFWFLPFVGFVVFAVSPRDFFSADARGANGVGRVRWGRSIFDDEEILLGLKVW